MSKIHVGIFGIKNEHRYTSKLVIKCEKTDMVGPHQSAFSILTAKFCEKILKSGILGTPIETSLWTSMH